jgi:hypothetical protein
MPASEVSSKIPKPESSCYGFNVNKLVWGMLIGLVATALPVGAALARPGSSSSTGYDISYPQCGKTLPGGQAFGVVGVNGGLATTGNPCFADQLKWAYGSSGLVNQPKAQLYVNTGNPGGLGTSSWPKNNTDPAGFNAPDPYGSCDGSDSPACSWQYGWNRTAEDDQRLVVAALGLGEPTGVTDYHWWLDVETLNTWESGSDVALASNRADLEGMVAYLKANGAATGAGGLLGVYSTGLQWGKIAGTVPNGSNLNNLNSWLAGAVSLQGAKKNCQSAPLGSGGWVSITQYATGGLDYDYSCL